MKPKPYQEGGRHGHWRNKLMMKFGNGIGEMLFESLGASGDPICNTNANASAMFGAATATADTRLHFSSFNIHSLIIIIIIIMMIKQAPIKHKILKWSTQVSSSRWRNLRKHKQTEAGLPKLTPLQCDKAHKINFFSNIPNQFPLQISLPIPLLLPEHQISSQR